ncbi:MAG: hypothetical protein JWM95_3788 [Gemmatimonadetes bacterium]|nr:hypothetical protein [Gemmatimonadota bacterium]
MLSPERWPGAAVTVARTFGARGFGLRAVHEMRRKIGAFRSEPSDVTISSQPAPLYHVHRETLIRNVDRTIAIERGERVVQGEYQAFRANWRSLPNGRGWLCNPTTGHEYDRDAPWWTVPHLTREAGDIKEVWEPARFAWVYDLVRAFLVSGDERYHIAFARIFADWLAANPPFRGVHWSCGQETAIRAIALLYAESNLQTVASAQAIAATLIASAERIDDAIGYAISQRNNHGISEAAALVALGVRFREIHPHASRWLARGRKCLARQIMEQFAVDGWYTQHSFTYMRLALDQCVVAERALRTIGETLPLSAANRLRSAVDLLSAVIEPESGTVPNHGANDGAFVHPITCAPYRDFRPVITAVCALWAFPMSIDLARCGETLAWLGVAQVPASPHLPEGVQSGVSGWAAARLGTTQVFMRAGRYTGRPGHIDPLHLDVRFGGKEVIVDPGTFAYNAAVPWNNALVGARVHNGPLVGTNEPGIRGPRFLWFSWPDATLTSVTSDGDTVRIIGTRPDHVRREVIVRENHVVVRDDRDAAAVGPLNVCWLLHPECSPDALSVDGATDMLAAAENEVRGWFSPLYGLRVPSRAVIAERNAADSASILTTIINPVRS